jgi:hypothetical protein
MLKAIAVISISAFCLSAPVQGQAQARDPEVQALLDRAQKAWDTPTANPDPVTERLFYRAAELERTTPVYRREEIVTTVEEALANKAGVPRYRALSALYYPKDGGYIVCGQGRYYRGDQEMNGAFVYSDMYGGIRIVDASENARKAYDCQSIANFRLR